MTVEDRKRLMKLEALEAAGVDNWEGYGWALELYQEYLEDEGLEDA